MAGKAQYGKLLELVEKNFIPMGLHRYYLCKGALENKSISSPE